ncbi:hypothetical protein BCR44DRAFT_211766 [Catenaria anguillulae PL171]|uniref:Uncharacterized protein n=1 Tax=Catenaria anguillulae PL171 TaxID=765915 RepID=A0A1Y2HZS0_9FUNG|nr:hypothetical protein BCR44DRAFT_211766 [Catenaria anguillulae PL171]
MLTHLAYFALHSHGTIHQGTRIGQRGGTGRVCCSPRNLVVFFPPSLPYPLPTKSRYLYRVPCVGCSTKSECHHRFWCPVSAHTRWIATLIFRFTACSFDHIHSASSLSRPTSLLGRFTARRTRLTLCVPKLRRFPSVTPEPCHRKEKRTGQCRTLDWHECMLVSFSIKAVSIILRRMTSLSHS